VTADRRGEFVLIEVPVMIMLVRICLRKQDWFQSDMEARRGAQAA